MIRVYKDNIVPKYVSGKWSWDEHSGKINFAPWASEVFIQDSVVKSSSGYQFKSKINQIEEVIFRQEFARPDTTFDDDAIVLQDIKNLVLFLAPPEILTNQIVDFVHTKTVDWFLNALVIYFEYFIRLVEYILVRRDEVTGKSAQVESSESTEIKRIYSEYLTQYRLILAREYSPILTGTGEMKPFYHLTPVVNISKTTKDRTFHEAFLAICTQVVWIAHHRRAYDCIDDEMNRLFRSHHFKLTRKDSIVFSHIEQELLYGCNSKRVNYRYQNSPLMQEIAYVHRRNLPILWIGHKMYRGTDPRMQQIELEVIIPDGQLVLVDISHGILGHPKKLYNTLLALDWDEVRKQEYTKTYDPYRLITQPNLAMPDLNTMKQKHKQFESYFALQSERYEYTPELIKKWKRRDHLVEYIKAGGFLTDIVSKCRKEIEEIGKTRKARMSIHRIAEFIALKRKLRVPKSGGK